MGKVTVASGRNLIRTAVRIDSAGNEIDDVTKEVVKPVEKPYVPTPEELAGAKKKTAETQAAPSNGLDQIITKKLEEKLGGAIEKALEKVDLEDLIGKAIDKALTPKQ